MQPRWQPGHPTKTRIKAMILVTCNDCNIVIVSGFRCFSTTSASLERGHLSSTRTEKSSLCPAESRVFSVTCHQNEASEKSKIQVLVTSSCFYLTYVLMFKIWIPPCALFFNSDSGVVDKTSQDHQVDLGASNKATLVLQELLVPNCDCTASIFWICIENLRNAGNQTAGAKRVEAASQNTLDKEKSIGYSSQRVTPQKLLLPINTTGVKFVAKQNLEGQAAAHGIAAPNAVGMASSNLSCMHRWCPRADLVDPGQLTQLM